MREPEKARAVLLVLFVLYECVALPGLLLLNHAFPDIYQIAS